jgi:hypothetical protein
MQANWYLCRGPCGLHKPFLFLEDIMEKSMSEVLAPIINEIRLEGLLDRWERERELKKVLRNRRGLNKAIRESRAAMETLKKA